MNFPSNRTYIASLFFFFFCLIFGTTGFCVERTLHFHHYSIFDGLSNSVVNCIYQDKNGFIWIGTEEGLNMFDGYTFKAYKHDLNDSTTIGHNSIKYINEDSENNLWIGTGASIDKYMKESDSFSHLYVNKSKSGKYEISDQNISKTLFMSFMLDSKDNIWFCFGSGLFSYNAKANTVIDYNPGNNTYININAKKVFEIYEDESNFLYVATLNHGAYKITPDLKKSFHFSGIYSARSFFEDQDGNIWLGSLNHGLYKSAEGEFNFEKYKFLGNHADLNNQTIIDITSDKQGNLILATHYGLVHFTPGSKKIEEYKSTTIQGNERVFKTINYLYKDRHSNIWLGTFKNSLFLIPSSKKSFNYINIGEYLHVASLKFDSKENLMVGLDGAGLKVFDKSFKLKKHITTSSDKIKVSSNAILTIFENSINEIFIGSYYGGVDVFSSLNQAGFNINGYNKKYGLLRNMDIRDILEDRDKKIWIATHEGGIHLFNQTSQKLEDFLPENCNKKDLNILENSYLYSLYEDTDGNIWMGSLEGLFKYDKEEDSLVLIKAENPNVKGLNNNVFFDIFQDSKQNMWFATDNGLHKLLLDSTNSSTISFQAYTTKNGLRNNIISSLIEDNKGNIWMGTNDGISCFNPNNESFKNYNFNDGLTGKEFSVGAVDKSDKGELFFGGPLGITYFDPIKIIDDTVKPVVLISDFKLFNQSVKPGSVINGRKILTNSITETSEIVLEYNENVFTFEFVGLHFLNPEEHQYKYMLEGFNQEWITTDARNRTATYTNINAGTYYFKVMASNSDGVWNKEGVSLKLIILPPFWKSNIAMLLYVLLAIIIVVLYRQLTIRKLKLENEVRIQTLNAEKEHEITETKIRFFTNISHEFRTPLTLIIGPIEKLLRTEKNNAKNIEQYKVIEKNAQRLLRLINQVLDLRKLEVGKLALQTKHGELVSFTNDIVQSFSEFSTELEIPISFESNVKELSMFFDSQKMETVLLNLISNAFKYTPNGKPIRVKLIKEDSMHVSVKIEDSGIGISPDQIDKIFDRFYQAKNLPVADVKGTGIGLSYVKDLIQLHQGSITVTSKVNYGTTFLIKLPIITESSEMESESVVSEDYIIDIEPQEFTLANETASLKGKKVLIVEDNFDLRNYLVNELKREFDIYAAKNGKIGLEYTNTYKPDIVVSDIMMPEMDGFDLCKQIKTSESTSHIPVILLTSKSEVDAELKGFDYGADDYVTKPFSMVILKARINNILKQRENLHALIKHSSQNDIKSVTNNKEDQDLLEKVIAFVELNIDNTQLNPDMLAREVGMSRTKLYNKLGKVSGHPVREFIKILRLKKAANYLEQNNKSVSEIAFLVGFKDLAHFSKSFANFYGESPKEYRNKV